MNVCRIVGAGDTVGVSVEMEEGDFLIAADGGLLTLQQQGLRPHLAVGDFDSLGSVPTDLPIVRYPVEKDDTDMAIAVEEGLSRGYTRFVLYGGMGGRVDHTLANIQLLTYLAKKGARGVLLDSTTALTVIADGGCWEGEAPNGTVSVFCLGDRAEGVTLRGLHYTLTDATLTCDRALGVSNAFVGERAAVSVRTGALLIVWQREKNRSNFRKKRL